VDQLFTVETTILDLPSSITFITLYACPFSVLATYVVVAYTNEEKNVMQSSEKRIFFMGDR
jgi:hypothetical protein